MIEDQYSELCKGCCKKHLSDALVRLKEDDGSVLNHAYISGHLSHAANHMVKLSPEIGSTIRDFRLKLEDTPVSEELISELARILISVDEFDVPKEDVIEDVSVVSPPTVAHRKKGCGCR